MYETNAESSIFGRKKGGKKKSHLVPEWHRGYVLTFSQLAAYGASGAYWVGLREAADGLYKNGWKEGS